MANWPSRCGQLGDLAPRLGRFAETRHRLVGLGELGIGFRELATISQPARLADQMKRAIAGRFIRGGIEVGRMSARGALAVCLGRCGRRFSVGAIEEIEGARQDDDAQRTNDCEAWQPH